VHWNSSGGHSTGIITKVYTKDFNFMGAARRASKEEPQYEVKSDRSGDKAVHKATALSKK
jgi:hypothetical protein